MGNLRVRGRFRGVELHILRTATAVRSSALIRDVYLKMLTGLGFERMRGVVLRPAAYGVAVWLRAEPNAWLPPRSD